MQPAHPDLEPPAEPILFLSRHTTPEYDLYRVQDEEGADGGHIDIRTGGVSPKEPGYEPVLHQLASHFVLTDGPGDHGSRWGRGKKRASGEVAVMACMEWRDGAVARLYVFRIAPGGVKEDLGFIDLVDQRTAAVVDGAEGVLRYCGAQFLATR